MSEAPNRIIGALKKHRLFRIATIYAVAGWTLIQFADVILEAFESPAWVMQAFLLLVLAGFPVTLTGIWLNERTQQIGSSRQIGSIITIALALLISVGAYQYFSPREPSQKVESPAVQQGRESNPVLAVLPFSNMSSLPENEFLADGMTEDIITLLAQSPGVEVIARNSTFQYKNQNPDIREVGRDLGADYVIEGSVRPLGERIRVTVQVIDASSGAHVWAEKYDRPLADFFRIQDEVSLGVAAAVGDAVFRNEYSEINQSRTDNLTAWSLTSQAEFGFHQSGMNDETGIAKARQAVELDPKYAIAHAVLGRALSFYSLNYRDSAVAKEAEAEARLALRLEPDDPKVNAFLAMTLLLTGQPVAALPYAERVTKISPSYAEGLGYYADILIHNGRSREALSYLDKAIRLTPNAPQLGLYQFLRGEALMHDGNFVDAETSLLAANRSFQDKHQMLLRYLAGTQLRLGKIDEAKGSLKKADDFSDRSIKEEQAAVEFISADGGGEYIKAIWVDLTQLSNSNSP